MAKFKKGQSGNPRGRPKGTSQAAKLRTAINRDLPAIIKAIATKAKAGDVAAGKLLLDRAIPPLKPKHDAVKVPAFDGTLTDQGRAILAQMASGNLSSDDTRAMLAALISQARIIEADELDRRVRALEECSESRKYSE